MFFMFNILHNFKKNKFNIQCLTSLNNDINIIYSIYTTKLGFCQRYKYSYLHNF